MATTMKAAILHGREDIRIERVPVPEAAPGELIVRVEAALTCGTDLKVFRRGYHARMIVPPALFGHELAGTVVQAGDGVIDFAPGDRIHQAFCIRYRARRTSHDIRCEPVAGRNKRLQAIDDLIDQAEFTRALGVEHPSVRE